MQINLNGVELQLVAGNITDQPDTEAIVNAANAHLLPGGGVAGAIHSAAGPGLEDECRPLAPISPGEAVITGGHNLANKYVIHCLGPVYGIDKPEEQLLSDCYTNILELADYRGITSVAIPAISTGAFGYPVDEAARVALKTILHKIPMLQRVKKVRLVLFSQNDLTVFENNLRALI